MNRVRLQLNRWSLLFFLVVSLFFASPIHAFEPRLIIMSPAPGEVVASDTLNVLIDMDGVLAPNLESPGYSIALFLDDNSEDLERAIRTVQRGYIYPSMKPGLHTLTAQLVDRDATGVVTVATTDTVEFQVSPLPGVPVPGIGPVSWYAVARDALIMVFPIVSLAILFFWMSYIIHKRRK